MSTTCGWKNPLTGVRDCQNPRWKVGATYCKQHEDEYRAKRRSAPAETRAPRVTRQALDLSAVEIPEGRSHAYIVPDELRALWDSEMKAMTHRPGGNFLFIGPPGSGKTDGAEELAREAGLDFDKVDAASMGNDPEAWFGVREIVPENGLAVTHYEPSIFVKSIQKAGVTFIDEVNRCRDEGRNIIIPVIDHTRAVINPLTGEVIERHPQNVIIMAGNVGLAFTGTSAIDPAFWTRADVVEFDYIEPVAEAHVVEQASGCDPETAYVLVQFAVDSRSRAANDEEFPAISTRELINTAKRVADGLQRDLAVKFGILNHASKEGGGSSLRSELQSIWNGKRAMKMPGIKPAPSAADPVASSTWRCPDHGTVKTIPAGVSNKTGQPYTAFNACAAYGCPNTESNSPGGKAKPPTSVPVRPGTGGLTCAACGQVNPAGRTTICVACGSAL